MMSNPGYGINNAVAANRAMVKRAPKTVPLSAKVMSVIKGTTASAKEIYPQGIFKALLKLK